MLFTKFMKKWESRKIEDYGPTTSPDYKEFQKDYQSVLKDICKSIDMTLTKFNKNHYCFSAVAQSNRTGQYFYISISDVRYSPGGWFKDILYRTMKHETDWTGGRNNFCSLPELPERLKRLDK